MNKHARAMVELLEQVEQAKAAEMMLRVMDESLTSKNISAMERRIRSWVNSETKPVKCPGWAPVILRLALEEKQK